MWNWERWASATGIAFVVSAGIAFLIVPDPPSADEGSEFILNFVALNDSDLLWQAFFFGLGGIFLLWFAGTLAVALRRAQGDTLDRTPPIVVAAAASAAALFLLGVTAVGALASGVEVMDQGVAYGLYQLASFAFVMTDFPAAAFVWAASLGIVRSGLLPASVGYVGGIVGLLLVVNAGGRLLADSSDFAPGGAVNTIVFAVFLFWVLVASIFLVQRVPVGRRMPES
ncbi:MAG TPA: hypothetical protein VFL61_11940 [Gaiellaceae bacterium]|nr:hypothetical protein [Gaiellaceae bacterium]